MMTCLHAVGVGDFCRYCGTTVDVDLVRAFAIAPTPPVRDPDIELFEDGHAVVAGECAECRKPVLVSSSGWRRCSCGTQSTILPAVPL